MNPLKSFKEGSLAQLGIILGGVIVCAVFGAILTGMGVSIVWLSLVFIIAGLVIIPLTGRAATVISPLSAGTVLSVEALSAFGLFGIVGSIFAFGHDGSAVMIGLALGFLLCLACIAPQLSSMNARSMPEFFSLRYGNGILRFMCLMIICAVSVLFLGAQLLAVGLVAEQVLGFASAGGILIGAIAIIGISLPLKKFMISYSQIILSATVLFAILLICAWILAGMTGIVVPHVAYGGLIEDIADTEHRLNVAATFGEPGQVIGYGGMICLAFSLAAGAAVMPHLLSRVTVEKFPEQSRLVLQRGVCLFVIVATALPALGVAARFGFLSFSAQAQNMLTLDALPEALRAGIVICGATGEAIQAACLEYGYTSAFPAGAVSVNPQSVLLALPSLSDAPGWIIAILSVVVLFTAATAGGGAAHTFAYAFCYNAFSRNMPENIPLVATAVTMTGAVFAAASGVGLIELAAWAYAMAAGSIAAPLVLGLWWKRTNAIGALCGMSAGFVLTALYIIGSYWGFDFVAGSGDEWRWFGFTSYASGFFGLIASACVTVSASLLGPKPRPSQIACLRPVMSSSMAIASPE